MAETAPGANTSEFKLTVGAISSAIIGIAVSLFQGNATLAVVLVAASTVLATAYALGRAWLKHEQAQTIYYLSPETEEKLDTILKWIMDAKAEVDEALPEGDGEDGDS